MQMYPWTMFCVVKAAYNNIKRINLNFKPLGAHFQDGFARDLKDCAINFYCSFRTAVMLRRIFIKHRPHR